MKSIAFFYIVSYNDSAERKKNPQNPNISKFGPLLFGAMTKRSVKATTPQESLGASLSFWAIFTKKQAT
jgi:hypothetical protein